MNEYHLTLLIIEDQKFSTDLFQAAFGQHTVLTAQSGSEGVQAYQKDRPNIVFLDIGLPDISGFEVLKQLKSLDKTAHIVMLSGMNNDAYIKKCEELGAEGFLTKPYQKDSIEHYIERYRVLKAGAPS